MSDTPTGPCHTVAVWLGLGNRHVLTLGPVALYRAEAGLSVLPSPPLACTHIALAATRPGHSYLLYINNRVVVWLQHNGEQHSEHD